MKLKNNKVYKIKVIECGCEHIGLVVGDDDQKIIVPDLETEFKTSELGELFEVISKVSSKYLFEEMVKEDSIQNLFSLMESKNRKLLEDKNVKLAKEVKDKNVIIKYLEGVCNV